jgi:hypothetical protein
MKISWGSRSWLRKKFLVEREVPFIQGVSGKKIPMPDWLGKCHFID